MLRSTALLLLVSVTNADDPIKGRDPIDIKILAFRRPASLVRLLQSLSRAAYDEQDKLDVDIFVDFDDSEERMQVVEVAKNWTWAIGQKTVHVRKAWVGLRKQWLECYQDVSRRAVILEDDVEVSPFYMQWLRRAAAAYGKRQDLAGSRIFVHFIQMCPSDHLCPPRNHPDAAISVYSGTGSYDACQLHWATPGPAFGDVGVHATARRVGCILEMDE
jgi:hypothetical protein